MSTEIPEGWDAIGDAESRLRTADERFDASPLDRRRALETYADLAAHLDPRSPVGLRRLLRVLSHGGHLDARLEKVFGRAAHEAEDPAVRFRARNASIRWAFAREELGRATAASRRLLAEFSVPPGPPAAAYAYLVNCCNRGFREAEEAALVARMETARTQGPSDAARAIQFRVSSLVTLCDWPAVLEHAQRFESARAGLAPPDARVIAETISVHCSHAFRAIGDLESARWCLRSLDVQDASSPIATEVRLADAANLLAAGSAEAAFAAALGVQHDPRARTPHRVRALVVCAQAADRLGRENEAFEVADALAEIVSGARERIGTGAVLCALGDVLNSIARPGAPRERVERLTRIAAQETATRILELRDFAVQDGGFAHLCETDAARLRRWRILHVTRHRLLLHELDGALARRSGAERDLVESALGGFDAWTACPVCLCLVDRADGGEPIPAGHLFGDRFRAELPWALCGGCRQRDAQPALWP